MSETMGEGVTFCRYRRQSEALMPPDRHGLPGVGSEGWRWCALPAGGTRCPDCSHGTRPILETFGRDTGEST